ncbi:MULTISPECIES: 4'-phosphopantetheinyl transferase family protein [Streptomyces]|uniref:4'-phosphopantetheinyl transferase family protein n=1 Tax=Streptomyces TaxID=1883 RepID=UPI001E40C3B3|nr:MULTISPECIES: 4'-phosphopantetheinyl transferase superfamily protein [Streptomyces]UFQ17186.1 4'-phosphopantetheinyl transferase superfamily protein [Streptomyces huasconensis]WCL86786.1 4'-phosphopantetheinyl transferase superfamily protein [Streptomyces sp. JCM 35825]
MIRDIVPSRVAAVDSFGFPPPARALYPQESALMAHATELRRDEFGAVRDCARLAMAELGRPAAPVLRGPAGEPLWPAGLVGSMAHCSGYQVAVLARADEFAAVGVDAEPEAPLPAWGMLETIAGPDERAMVAGLAREHSGVSWGRLLFSAKECVYKAWFPWTRKWLGFRDVDVRIDPITRTFSARLPPPGLVVEGTGLSMLTGRWTTGRGILLTAITVPVPPSGEGRREDIGLRVGD